MAEKRCKKPNHVSHRAPWRPVNRVHKHSGAQSANKPCRKGLQHPCSRHFCVRRLWSRMKRSSPRDSATLGYGMVDKFCPFRSVQKLRIFGNGEKIRAVQNVPIILIKGSSQIWGFPTSASLQTNRHVLLPKAQAKLEDHSVFFSKSLSLENGLESDR